MREIGCDLLGGYSVGQSTRSGSRILAFVQYKPQESDALERLLIQPGLATLRAKITFQVFQNLQVFPKTEYCAPSVRFPALNTLHNRKLENSRFQKC